MPHKDKKKANNAAKARMRRMRPNKSQAVTPQNVTPKSEAVLREKMPRKAVALRCPCGWQGSKEQLEPVVQCGRTMPCCPQCGRAVA